MSTTSHPWKQHLLHQADALDKLRGTKRWTEPTAIKLEESIVLGFYAIRRLIGSFLLSEAAVHRPVTLTAFPARRPAGTVRLGDEDLKQLYDLATGRTTAHDLSFLCHQVLHNCALAPQFSPDHVLTGILVTSDHQRKVALYGISLDALVALFRGIGEG